MNEQKDNGHTGQKADEAQQTLELFAEKLDDATQCPPDPGPQSREKPGTSVENPAGKNRD